MLWRQWNYGLNLPRTFTFSGEIKFLMKLSTNPTLNCPNRHILGVTTRCLNHQAALKLPFHLSTCLGNQTKKIYEGTRTTYNLSTFWDATARTNEIISYTSWDQADVINCKALRWLEGYALRKCRTDVTKPTKGQAERDLRVGPRMKSHPLTIFEFQAIACLCMETARHFASKRRLTLSPCWHAYSNRLRRRRK